MDGFELAGQIKRRQEARTLPRATLLLLTSAGQAGDAARCRDLGIKAHLMKPIKQSELLATILAALGTAPRRDMGMGAAPLALESAAPSAAVGDGPRPLRILLAEDNPINQKLAVRLLQKQGYAVAVVEDGKEALAALERESFDVVLMDVQMPEMDGLETTGHIRAREQGTGRHVPVIAMTAHAMKGDRERCLQAGMDGYISKPVQPAELFEAIARLLR
jgi:two-component system sensor histidine kinase/response regulator